jgi:hypothetical protein
MSVRRSQDILREHPPKPPPPSTNPNGAQDQIPEERHRKKGVQVDLDTPGLDSKIPLIQLPQDNRLDSEFATELGLLLSNHDIYQFHGCAVKTAVDKKENLVILQQISAAELCTFIEYFCIPFKIRQHFGQQSQVIRSLATETAGRVLASSQFLNRLRPITGLNSVPLPVFNSDGNLHLLPAGYDANHQILTLESISYDEALTKADALKLLKELLIEFPFHEQDKERAISVVFAFILTLFCTHLFSDSTVRPGFLFSANETGSGKSLLAKLGLIPILGCAPTGVAPKDEEEMRKRITTAVLSGRSVLFFDNLKGRLSSPSLEALITSNDWEDRLLGSNRQFNARHQLCVVLTGNDTVVSPDIMRRVFTVEMFNPYADGTERPIKCWLDGNTIKTQYRTKILSACWTLVRDWNQKGRPEPEQWHHDFRPWAAIICGIIEAIGLGSPCGAAILKRSGDRDRADMHELVTGMEPEADYSLETLADVCEKAGIFDRFTALRAEKPGAFRSTFGKYLKKYEGRRFTDNKCFELAGDHKNRTYRITKILC